MQVGTCIRNKDMKMELKDRKSLPLFGTLPLSFDINKILDAFEPFANPTQYNDLNGQAEDAEFGELCKQKRSLHAQFLHDEEVKVQQNSAYNSEYYRQLSLTEFDGDNRDIDYQLGVHGSYKASAKPGSSAYNPLMDERRYTRRKDICTGYWNHVLDQFTASVTRTRFASMAPNFAIKPHIDYNTTYSIRVHIPIITNDKSFLCVKYKGETYKQHCPADGRVYFMNTGLTHWAENNGDEERIHLVISLNGQDDITGLTDVVWPK